MVFFFFKQKTAYEMRISDWSSDVCSSDLLAENAKPENARYGYDYFTDNCATRVRDAIDTALGGSLKSQIEGRSHGTTYRSESVRLASPAPWMWLGFDIGLGPAADQPLSVRSEEHTSELQSLMRISYAVFCLKK